MFRYITQINVRYFLNVRELQWGLIAVTEAGTVPPAANQLTLLRGLTLLPWLPSSTCSFVLQTYNHKVAILLDITSYRLPLSFVQSRRRQVAITLGNFVREHEVNIRSRRCRTAVTTAAKHVIAGRHASATYAPTVGRQPITLKKRIDVKELCVPVNMGLRALTMLSYDFSFRSRPWYRASLTSYRTRRSAIVSINSDSASKNNGVTPKFHAFYFFR